jgi:hypothetical protein
MTKTPIRFLAPFAAMFLLTLPRSAHAAVDTYLKIQGVKGESRVVRCVDGTCSVKDLTVGQYMISVCDENGVDRTVEVALEYRVITARERGSGMATGRTARERGTGMATGKRMHKPMRITKEWDRSKIENLIAIEEPGAELELRVTAVAVAPTGTKE